ncbi:MAG TPA: alpha/beta hydrolase domain-containing protein [Candidatus Methylomirabilis sp.]|nr:alpha/beta hydrolase domain-containing protein [Candidatus Methylomirabilis sp.]
MPVTHFELTGQRVLAGGAAFRGPAGEIGPYEELKGVLRFSIDPLHPANRRITDVELAPRTAAGRVDWSADVSILLPVDRARCRGRILLDVVNRGNTVAVPNFNRASRPVFLPGSDPNPPVDTGDGFLMKRGWVVISCGWQGDVPEIAGLFRMRTPEARDAGGRPLRGRVHSQLQSAAPVTHFLLSDRGHIPYPAADLDEREALLTVRDQPDGPEAVIARERWRFARPDGAGIASSPHHIHLDGGFEKGRLYQITYTAVGAPVQGLSMAALRDSVSWLKHAGTGEGNPVPGQLRWAYAYGRSQTGRLLRTLLYEDLNLDEQGREALDGVIANVAGGMRGEFNQRFGQNSKDRNNMMAHLFPFADQAAVDQETGVKDALHARLDARGSRVRVFYTNSSAEYHRGDASLLHTDPDGRQDLAPGRHTRVYHFAGTEHGLGIWPPTDTQVAPADPTGAIERSQNLRGVLDYSPLLRALLVRLDRWVVDGVEPPASRHPRLDDSTAVPPAQLDALYGRIAAARAPRHHARPRRLDWTALPPRPGRAFGSLVSAVDADGNEVAGIALPELAVPLATHTGWNLRHPDSGGAEQLLVFAGATIPFARTRAEREATGDPRPSVAERYVSRADYLERVGEAARALARDGYLLEEDIEISVAAAARHWDHLAG